ncbi:ribosome-associated protein [Pseudarcicella hirudinis]|uniref:Ribosome-associated protein n=1 Tax=Pseudarcicella hirudinis TaxID=1079859 RepID=A0A1I5RLU4_9BACT|nr:alternative ribosome rescue aminoacyl-tRNA hydrolase ArfB [Pseudarcicella hirudinis]SFP59453.1 ribosome-associated protein [Pseudarcicella hirudinis]
MNLTELLNQEFSTELQFKATTSGGPGGQNVNKVATKVELRFNISESNLLDEAQKNRLSERLKKQINAAGELIVIAQEERTQLKNKTLAIRKFKEILKKNLTEPKKRKATEPTLSSITKRLETKKKDARKKSLRSERFSDSD